MDSYQGQITASTSPSRITTTANSDVGSGLVVTASTDVYYKNSNTINTTNGRLIVGGTETTINAGEFLRGSYGRPDLSTMYFVTASVDSIVTYSVIPGS